MPDRPTTNAPDPADVPKANASKEPPAFSGAPTGVGGIAGPSEGPPPASAFPDFTEPGRATSLAPGVGLGDPVVEHAAVPANTNLPPSMIAPADGVPLSQAAELEATGKHPFQMTEAQRSRLPIIVSRDGEDAVAERVVKGVTDAAKDNPKKGKYVKVEGVVGTFGMTVFGNDNISTKRVLPQDLDSVRSQFPNAEIEELDEHPRYLSMTESQRKLAQENRLAPNDPAHVRGAGNLVSPRDSMAVNEGLTAKAKVSGSGDTDKSEVSDEDKTAQRGPLPDTFPGFHALEEAGEATYAKLRKRIKEGTLRDIDGIGPATEEQIIEEMGEEPGQ